MITAIILIIYIAFAVGIGVYFHRKQQKSVNAYVLGGRSVGPWITAFAYGTSYFSAVIFIGYAGQFGWNYGVAATWIGLGNAFIGSLMAWAILGSRTRTMSKHLDTATMPQFFERRFNSKPLKIISALIVFIFLIPYTASVYNGLSRLFGMAFNIEDMYAWIIIGMAVITAVYVILGGYKATAINDFVQGIIMLVGIVIIIAAILGNKGGLYGAMTELSKFPVESGDMAGMQGGFTSFFGPDLPNLIGVVVLTSLGTWGLPQMVTKFYTIKDERSIKPATVVSTVFAIIVAGGCYFLGSFGKLFVTPEQITSEAGKLQFDMIVPTMLGCLPEILLGVVVVLVLSASMSTLSSLVLTSSSTLTLDLIKPIFKKRNIDEKKTLLIMRLFIAVFLVISVVIALNKNTLITDLMGYSWGALAGAFLAPFLYSLFCKGVTKTSVYVSFIFAISATIVHLVMKSSGMLSGTILGFTIASPVNLGAFIMVVGLIIVPIVSLFTPKMKKEDLEPIFSCFAKTTDAEPIEENKI